MCVLKTKILFLVKEKERDTPPPKKKKMSGSRSTNSRNSASSHDVETHFLSMDSFILVNESLMTPIGFLDRNTTLNDTTYSRNTENAYYFYKVRRLLFILSLNTNSLSLILKKALYYKLFVERFLSHFLLLLFLLVVSCRSRLRYQLYCNSPSEISPPSSL